MGDMLLLWLQQTSRKCAGHFQVCRKFTDPNPFSQRLLLFYSKGNPYAVGAVHFTCFANKELQTTSEYTIILQLAPMKFVVIIHLADCILAIISFMPLSSRLKALTTILLQMSDDGCHS
jgi:hypothetical protein